MDQLMSKRSLRGWTVAPCIALACLGLACLAPHSGAAAGGGAAASQEQVANVEKLKADAFDAAKAGKFDRTSALLDEAAGLSKDPSLARMVQWTSAFENQRKQFAAERHKQYEKEVSNVRLLLHNKKDDFAIDAAASAYGLADDKEAFRNEKWVD